MGVGAGNTLSKYCTVSESSFDSSSTCLERDRSVFFCLFFDFLRFRVAFFFSVLVDLLPEDLVRFSYSSTIWHIWLIDAFGITFSTAEGEQSFIADSSHKVFGDMSCLKIFAICVGDI